MTPGIPVIESSNELILVEMPERAPKQLSMKTTKKLMPGQPDTKKFLEQFESDLVCPLPI
jgi:hypothetical protein